jgi:hypothetical protein
MLMVKLNGHRLVMPLPAASALIDKVALGESTEPQDVARARTPHFQPG